MSEIAIEDFTKLDLRVGQIVSAEKPVWSDKLIKMQVDFGPPAGGLGIKQVFSGIGPWYKPEELVGKQAIFLVNLPSREIHGEISEVMILTVEDKETASYIIVIPQKEASNGSRVC